MTKFKESSLESKVYRVEALTSDGNKIGGASLFIITSESRNQPYGLIENVFVEEEYRDNKLGPKLVREVVQIAQRENCYKVIGTSRFRNEYIHGIYRNLGFNDYGIEFRLSMSGDKTDDELMSVIEEFCNKN